MKTISIMFALIFVSCASNEKSLKFAKWTEMQDILNPESIYHDSDSRMIIVSNIDGGGNNKDGKGHLSLFSENGTPIDRRWVQGLNAPKGMRSSKGSLWVSDIDEVVKIDIAKGIVTEKYKVDEAVFLNDVAIASNGDVYVSDTLTSKIHRIRDGKVETFIEGKDWESPNGLLVVGDELVVAAWGFAVDWSTSTPGNLYKINLESKEKTLITKKPLGNLDGLERLDSGDYLVSDWRAGKIYQISDSGKVREVFSGKKGLADIGLISKSQTVLVPYMENNQVFSLKFQ